MDASRVVGLDGGGSAAEVIARDLVWVNAGWAAYNLLPMLPLDGGRVLASSLLIATAGKGQKAALVSSVAVGLAVAAAAAWAGWWWLAVLTLFLVAGDAAALNRWEPARDAQDDE